MVLKGNILYMADKDTLCAVEKGYLAVSDGHIAAVYTEDKFSGSAYAGESVLDYGDKLIIPGMVDLHLHAPQFSFCGVGMDEELLDWLNQYAFQEEIKYADADYAKMAYGHFVQALLQSPTTRACIFTTIHKDSALQLAKMLEEAGFAGYIGKVNMDREAPELLTEETHDSLEETRSFIETMLSGNSNMKPIITPRFVPSCSNRLMAGLGELRQIYNLPVQSHLSENLEEVEWVKKLNPEAEFYGDAYDMFGLFGGGFPTVMAHCVYSTEAEMERMKQNGVYVAHCANSNFSLASGIAPIRKYMHHQLKIGLGTDVAGGFSISMFRAIQDTITVSKLYWRMQDQSCLPLSFTEAFYLATLGGGGFFGEQTGSFLPGYDADILVLDDFYGQCPLELDIKQRLERVCYLADCNTVHAKYIKGKLVMFRTLSNEG